ncbi:uncharacterized protein LOC141648069 [Silene latifolia]|uniref:uncharacterized protein LOC141648069 n=1 Tax=Silene latifolia TaxID=37657 RepID=UPI003D7773A2
MAMSERIGSEVSTAELKGFQECVDECGLLDLPAQGAFFTWNNKHELRAMTISLSNEPERRKGVFKYFNMWGKDPKFKDIVQVVWYTQIPGYKMFQCVKKLKLLKLSLKQLNGNVFGNIETSANVAKMFLHNVQKQLHSDPNNVSFQQVERDAAISYRELEGAKRSFLAQKSKAQWMDEGDDNTHYFHCVLKARRMSNKVLCIQDMNGITCSSVQAIEDAFVAYYVHLLGNSKLVNPVHVPTVRKGKTITAEHC